MTASSATGSDDALMRPGALARSACDSVCRVLPQISWLGEKAPLDLLRDEVHAEGRPPPRASVWPRSSASGFSLPGCLAPLSYGQMASLSAEPISRQLVEP